MTCPKCSGNGEYDVIDRMQIRATQTSPPYAVKRCDLCHGAREVSRARAEKWRDEQ